MHQSNLSLERDFDTLRLTRGRRRSPTRRTQRIDARPCLRIACSFHRRSSKGLPQRSAPSSFGYICLDPVKLVLCVLPILFFFFLRHETINSIDSLHYICVSFVSRLFFIFFFLFFVQHETINPTMNRYTYSAYKLILRSLLGS